MRVVGGLKDEISTKGISGLYYAVIAATAVVIPAVLSVRAFLNFRNQSFLSHVDGVWLTCAFDFVHGVLYRPLFGPLGYGGVRYFPLYFVLTGGLSKVLGSLESSGLILSAASVSLLSCACYVLLRRLQVSVLLSLAAVTAVYAVVTTQEALLGTKADGLAAMLNLWGVTLCVGSKPKLRLLYLAAALFTLAFATKLTTVFGSVAIILGWFLARRYKEAWRLGLATFSGYVLVLSAVYFGSQGRALEIFRACATGGGSLTLALQAPYQMLVKAAHYDPLMLLFLVPAAALALSSFKDNETKILLIYFVLVLLVTVIIFGSPGTMINHLLDLHVAAVVLIAVSISRSPSIAEVGTGILALSLFVACASTVHLLHGDLYLRSLRLDAQQVLARLPSDSRPVLAENPLVVLKSGKTPYLLDPFMFRVLTSKRPGFGKDMQEKITHKGFSAIILQFDARSYRPWYRETHFGGEFLQDLDASYSYNYRVGEMYVFTPK